MTREAMLLRQVESSTPDRNSGDALPDLFAVVSPPMPLVVCLEHRLQGMQGFACSLEWPPLLGGDQVVQLGRRCSRDRNVDRNHNQAPPSLGNSELRRIDEIVVTGVTAALKNPSTSRPKRASCLRPGTFSIRIAFGSTASTRRKVSSTRSLRSSSMSPPRSEENPWHGGHALRRSRRLTGRDRRSQLIEIDQADVLFEHSAVVIRPPSQPLHSARTSIAATTSKPGVAQPLRSAPRTGEAIDRGDTWYSELSGQSASPCSMFCVGPPLAAPPDERSFDTFSQPRCIRSVSSRTVFPGLEVEARASDLLELLSDGLRLRRVTRRHHEPSHCRRIGVAGVVVLLNRCDVGVKLLDFGQVGLAHCSGFGCVPRLISTTTT